MSARLWPIVAVLELFAIIWLLAGRPGDRPDPVVVDGPAQATEADDAGSRRADAEAGTEVVAAAAPAVERTVAAAAAAPLVGGTTLIGRVVDARSREALTAGYLNLRQRGETRWRGVGLDEEPFAFAGLAAGTWEVWIRNVPGYVEGRLEIEVGAGPLQEEELELSAATVLYVATQTPDGAPLGKALYAAGISRAAGKLTYVATREPPPAAFPETELRHVVDVGCARFRSRMFGSEVQIPERYEGVLEVDGGLPVWVSMVNCHVVVASQLVQPGSEEVVFQLSVEQFRATTATVRARVLASESGQPLEGAYVSLTDRQSGGGGVATDADGRVTLTGVAPGLLELGLRAPEREFYVRYVRIPAGGDVDLGDLRVDPPGKAGGVVVDAGGQPVADVGLLWTRVDRQLPGAPLRHGMSSRSDSEGRFDLGWLGRGRYLVRATHAEHGVARLLVDTSAGAVDDLRLQLAPATRVQIEGGLAAADVVRLSLREPGGAVFLTVGVRPGQQPSFGVLPGRYLASIHRGAVLVREFELQVGSAPVTLRVP